MIKTDKGLVNIEGLSVEIMADFRVICRALRKTFVEEFGEDQVLMLHGWIHVVDGNC